MKKEPFAPVRGEEAEIAPNPFSASLKLHLTGREQKVKIFTLEESILSIRYACDSFDRSSSGGRQKGGQNVKELRLAVNLLNTKEGRKFPGSHLAFASALESKLSVILTMICRPEAKSFIFASFFFLRYFNQEISCKGKPL